MPKGYNKDGTSTASNFTKKKPRAAMPIQDEGADGPKAPAPSQGEVAKAMPLPASVKSASQEAAAAVASSKATQASERSERAKRARIKTFKAEGENVGWMGRLVGTSGSETVRAALTEMAGVTPVEDGHFYITKHDRGGRGSDCQVPTVWFECEVAHVELATEAPGVTKEGMQAAEAALLKDGGVIFKDDDAEHEDFFTE